MAEACAKSDTVWLRPAGRDRARAAWHVWHEGEVCVVTGPGEQQLPDLDALDSPVPTVEVIVPSKDTRARLVTFTATHRLLESGTPEWLSAAEALAASRLNAVSAPDGAGMVPHWAEEAQIHALLPDELIEAVAGTEETPDDRLAPPDSPGTTLTRRPFHLGRRRRRARRLGH